MLPVRHPHIAALMRHVAGALLAPFILLDVFSVLDALRQQTRCIEHAHSFPPT